MREPIEVLRSVQLFKPLDDEALHALVADPQSVTFAPGTRFITEGQVDEDAYVIIEGRAEVSVRGRKVATITEGDVIGEVAAVASRPRTASVTATTRVRAIVLTAGLLRGLMRDFPNFAAVMARQMSQRSSG